MVRRLAGTLVEVGRGNLVVADIERMLRGRSSESARWTAPPSGLFLERVDYGPATARPRPATKRRK
jgi:tRNA pseudouridine38-40 synthase